MRKIFLLFLFTSVALAADSCVGRCGENDGTSGCQCNAVCSDYGDCCSDYESVCFSCEDRCGDTYVSTAPCHCNSECSDHGNCCDDYSDVCDGGSSGGPSDADIIALTEELYTLDQPYLVNDLITIDTSPPGPLFVSVDSAAFTGPTISAFMALRDNYDPYTTNAEVEDSTESAEKEAFLDAVMATDVMVRTEAFMNEYGMISQSLRDAIDEIFFTLYPRDGDTLGSSGFEHSFMGEIDDGSVKGFHNWISFYEEEAEGDLSYTSFIDEETIGSDLELFMMGFDWLSYTKSISSMWIGSTPELELALYTLCFYHKPNALCDVSMNGVPYQIQTYTQSCSAGSCVGSAYPDIE